MQVKLLRDWAGYKKSALIEINDESVLKKGLEIKLFEELKEKPIKLIMRVILLLLLLSFIGLFLFQFIKINNIMGPEDLKKYSYISSTQPYTMFRDAFFSNPKSVRSNSSVFDTYLYEGGNSLTIKQDQEIIQFQGQANTTRPFDIFLTSFDSIKKIGASYGSTRVIDQLDNAIDYRTFVEGFPIFGENHEAQIAFDFKESSESSAVRVTIQANLNSLQIPIPSEESVVLPSSQEVIETLYYKGLDTTLVESLLIGYQWKDLEDTGVVDLIPNWYIKYDNQWYRYEALFQLLAEEEEEAPNGF